MYDVYLYLGLCVVLLVSGWCLRDYVRRIARRHNHDGRWGA